MMHRFDAAELARQFEALPIEARVAFGLACAEHLAGCSSRPARTTFLRSRPACTLCGSSPGPIITRKPSVQWLSSN